MSIEDNAGYGYSDGGLNDSHGCLLPTVFEVLANVAWPKGPRRIFDLGCGNGGVANELAKRGYEIAGIDASTQGIQQANLNYPTLKLAQGSAYDDLAGQYGQFPVVLSLEVVEHLYSPRKFAKTIFDLVVEGGIAIVSTPYHGYWKNIALAISGKLDQHFTALWDHGHIKFWSIGTLSTLLNESGFQIEKVFRVGRVPPIAKSMILVARKTPLSNLSR